MKEKEEIRFYPPYPLKGVDCWGNDILRIYLSPLKEFSTGDGSKMRHMIQMTQFSREIYLSEIPFFI